MAKARKDTLDRLVERMEVNESGCWLSTFAKVQGYAHIGYVHREDGRIWQGTVHRLAYELLVGPVPGGFELDHLCRVRHCFNPDHLEPVSRRENVMRGDGPTLLAARAAGGTHCRRGHEFTEANAKLIKGGRRCRACLADWHRERERRCPRRLRPRRRSRVAVPAVQPEVTK